MSNWNKHILPHGPLTELAPNLWNVRGSLPNMPMPRNMIVHRLRDGTLLLHSVIALNNDEMTKLEALGRPSVMIVPNGYHRLDAPVYKERYPDLKVYAPAKSREKVQEKVSVDGTCEDALPALGIEVLTPDGTRGGELAYLFDVTTGKALVVTDLLFNLPHATGLNGFVLRYITTSTGGLKVTRLTRIALVSNKTQLKGWLRKLASRDDLRIIAMAHGTPVVGECKAPLESVANQL